MPLMKHRSITCVLIALVVGASSSLAIYICQRRQLLESRQLLAEVLIKARVARQRLVLHETDRSSSLLAEIEASVVQYAVVRNVQQTALPSIIEQIWNSEAPDMIAPTIRVLMGNYVDAIQRKWHHNLDDQIYLRWRAGRNYWPLWKSYSEEAYPSADENGGARKRMGS